MRVACFGELAEALNGKVTKGARVYADGRLRLEQWAGQDGAQRSTLKLTAWVLTPMGLESRRPRQEAQNVHSAPSGVRRMPERVAVHGTRVRGATAMLDSDDDLGQLPF